MSCNNIKDSCSYRIDGTYSCIVPTTKVVSTKTAVPKQKMTAVPKQKMNVVSRKTNNEKFNNYDEDEEEENFGNEYDEAEEIEEFDHDEEEEIEEFDDDEEEEKENFNGHKEHITNAPYKKCLCE